MNLIQEVLQAEHRIRPYLRETPLEYSFPLSQATGCQVYLKLENFQPTGSFKPRGALSKMLALSPQQRKRGVVAASTGNHGAAVAFAAQTLKMKGLVFVPENASATKLEAMRRYGVKIRVHGEDSVITETFARDYARRNNVVYISPYNDPQVIGGQGTIGVELGRQLEHIDAVFVALGGGGMISGIGGYLKMLHSGVKIIGCSPKNSCVMAASVRANRILEMESLPTLSDGTAGGVELEAITLELCQKLVDEYVLVTEEEIKQALRLFIETQHLLIEGSAAVAVQGFLKNRKRFRKKNVVIVICGGNVSLATLKMVL